MTAWRTGASAAGVANSDTTLTVPAPSPAPQVGDTALAWVAGAPSEVPTYTPPDGWTVIPDAVTFDAGSPGVSLAAYWKRLTAADLASSTWGWTPAHGVIVTVSVYAPSAAGRAVQPVEAAATPASTSSTTRTTPSVTTAGARTLVAAYADRSGSTWTPGAGQTVRHDLRRGTASSLLVTDTAGDVAAGTHTRTATASVASGTRAEGVVALAEVAAAPVLTTPASSTVEPFDVVALTATADRGTPAWSQVSGSTVALAGSGGSVSFVAPATAAGAAVVLRASVTDGGLTTTRDVTTTVLPHNEWEGPPASRRPIRFWPADGRPDGSGTTPPVTPPTSGLGTQALGTTPLGG